MSKVYGLISEFTPYRGDYSRKIYAFGMEAVDTIHATWYEGYIYKKINRNPSIEDIRNMFVEDINEMTVEKIRNGFTWDDKPVYLSDANQRNFVSLVQSAADQTFPLKFKIGEDENSAPVYHTFADAAELNAFYVAMVNHITSCLQAGWDMKDSIDYSQWDKSVPTTESNSEN